MATIKIINKSKNEIPKYQTENSAGVDIRASLDEDLVLKAGEFKLVSTGIYLEIPSSYEVQIRARSGLSIKHGIGLVNGIGTIDSDYRGEIKVPLINFSKEDFTIENGMRIAQMVLSKYEKINFEEVDELSDSERQDGGFGSTGVK
ncbi:MAG: dUTP diphosphatase [Fenollaria massiliensis]|uniref:Deoxyuridine 5'-triphosphate nucleotidohydrolase n=1 Tax=Fenollaria massiliensis TaxID=938288 RepID=A0A9E7DIK2_9FIRM|nr:dUTP diphosphatase [Fenollaria massiliensis]AVM66352.1 dUTP diphosphatase [Peptostreptococcaceae bacterium oral taxon 929]UQK58580.1 dUTP diphosphatase [Fenollaria massiliensis]